MDITAGVTEAGNPQIDLSARIETSSPKIDLSAGVVNTAPATIDLSPGMTDQPTTTDAPVGEIRSYSPSVWDRIKSTVLSGIPHYSSRTPSDPNYGQMQLLSPADAMTPSEQREHPILTGVGEVAGGLTSPESVALIAGTGGLGELPGAAAMLPRLMSAGFGAQSIYAAAKTYPEIKAAMARGDVAETERLLTHAVLDIGMAALAGRHAAKGGAPVRGETEASAPPAIRPIEPTSPLGEVLHDAAPDVRVAETTAAKDHAVNADTATAGGDASASVGGTIDIAELRVPTARIVSDEHVPVVSRDEVSAQSVQNILDNSAELRRAGIDPSTVRTNGDIDAVLMRASDHIQSHLGPRVTTPLTFDLAKQLARETGKSVEDVISLRSGESLNAENLLAARMVLKSSYNHVLDLAREAGERDDAESRDAFTTALSQHKAIQERVAGVRAESGRALGSFRIGESDLPETKIANIFGKLPDNLKADAVRLIGKLDQTDPNNVRVLNQFVEKLTPRTTLEKLHEYYRNALLSSPHTIFVKTASEAAMAAMEAAKKVVAGGIAKAKDSPDRFASEGYYYAKGMSQALGEHFKPIMTGEFQLEGSPDFERAPSQAIKGTLGSIIRVPSAALSRMTNLVYTGNYFGEINSLAARQALIEGLDGDNFHARQEYLAHHPTEEMQEAAHELATRNTFQSRLTGFAQKVGSAISTKPDLRWLPESMQGVPPLKFLFPFYRTPVNLLKATITHATPYELLNGFAKGDTDAMARGVLGSSISAGLAYLAITGRITGGGPTDFRKEETLRATGWQPYSVKIGSKYYSYRRFEPVGLAAGLIADTVHGMKNGDSETVSQSKADTAVKHVMRNLDDFPFLGTLSNLLQAVHDPVGGRAQAFLNRQAGSIVPSGVANVAETLDPTVRRPKTSLQAIESRIPGLTSRAPAITDIAGREVKRPTNNLGGANPFPASPESNDPVLRELARLGVATPQPPTSVKRGGRTTVLSDAQRQQLAQQEGHDLHDRMSRIVSSATWQRSGDQAKRKQVTELRRQIEEKRPSRIVQNRH